MFVQYIQGICESRLATADHTISQVAHVTTTAQSLERSNAQASYIFCVGLHRVRVLLGCGNITHKQGNNRIDRDGRQARIPSTTEILLHFFWH
jgi:hypothetical protein